MAKHYIHRTRVNAPLESVAQFHQDSRALKLLSPPGVFIQLHEVQPLEERSKADFTMWLGPIPVRWVAEHSNVDPLRGFTDTQIRGPFIQWVHQHSFVPVSEGVTDVVDEITAEPGRHPFWGLVSRFMLLNLPILFAYRGRITRQSLEQSTKSDSAVSEK